MEILKLKASEKERKKIIKIKKNSLQKQKGLPTLSVDLNKTNHPISSNSHPSATANKTIHSLKIGGGGYKTNGNII